MPTKAIAPSTPEVVTPPSESGVVPGKSPPPLWQRLWGIIRGYPIPFSALVLLCISGVLWAARHTDLARWSLVAIILIGGLPLLWETLRQLWHRHFGVDVIAILAIGGSLLLGEELAGAIIVLMLSGGEALEAFALRRARSSLSALAERAPRTAHIWREGALIDIAADAVEIDMRIVVKPGEIIPVDGVVESGTASVNEADVTGEPVPIAKAPGALVLSGSVCLDSMLDVRALKRSAESQYAQIVRLVESAQAQKAPIHRLADRYSVGFTLVTIILVTLTWLITRNHISALAVLVVATPCPLILATPIAIMSGIDRAAKRGIILKSGAAMEQLGEVDVAVFDKTGTLTLGMPRLTELVSMPGSVYSEDLLLQLAASIEQLSAHVLARAVVDAARERELSTAPAHNFAEVFGKGVQGSVTLGGATYAVALGNRTFMRSLAVALPEVLMAERESRVESGDIASILAIDGQAVALIVLADIPRPELAQLAPALRSAGIRQTVLLTGDSEVVAQRIGRLAGMDRIEARCLPETKVRVVRELEADGHHVLMVGDGVNDAPALATATVGMAIGIQGLTASASAADAVLIAPDVLRVPQAVQSGRWVLHVAKQGIWVGMGLSGVAMLFAAWGYLPPAAGALLQEGIDVIVILNALRAGR